MHRESCINLGKRYPQVPSHGSMSCNPKIICSSFGNMCGKHPLLLLWRQIKISVMQITISHIQFKISHIQVKISGQQIKRSQIQIKISHTHFKMIGYMVKPLNKPHFALKRLQEKEPSNDGMHAYSLLLVTITFDDFCKIIVEPRTSLHRLVS